MNGLMSKSEDRQIGDLLDAITTGLQRGDAVEPLIGQSEKPDADVEEMVDIIQSLHASLTPLDPSQEFADGLRADLLAGRAGVVGRLRGMPARVHFAAILAVFAGCVLFMLRRVFGSEAAQDIQEEAVATPL